MSSMWAWHAPQSPPARQARVTSETVCAPPSMALQTSLSVTARQRHTYIGDPQRKLPLEPVHVLLGLDQNRRQQGFGPVVADVAAQLDPLVEPRNGLEFVGQIVAQDLDDALPDGQLVELLKVGQALEKEDPLDELVCVLHLPDRLVVDLLAEVLVAPVQAHPGVQEVLVDGGQLAGEHFVQDVDDAGVALHGRHESTSPDR